METNNRTSSIEPTKANIEKAIDKINQYALTKGYQLKGDAKQISFLDKVLTFFSGSDIKFDSKSQAQVCRDYLTRLDRKMGMSTANRFLHFLYKKVYKSTNPTPYVDYSEKELQIKAARKAWKKLQTEADLLLKAYKKEKGDFYKIN